MLTPFLGAFALALADRWQGEVDVVIEETRWGVELGVVFCPTVGVAPAAVVIVPVAAEDIRDEDAGWLAWETADQAIVGLRELFQRNP